MNIPTPAPEEPAPDRPEPYAPELVLGLLTQLVTHSRRSHARTAFARLSAWIGSLFRPGPAPLTPQSRAAIIDVLSQLNALATLFPPPPPQTDLQADADAEAGADTPTHTPCQHRAESEPLQPQARRPCARPTPRPHATRRAAPVRAHPQPPAAPRSPAADARLHHPATTGPVFKTFKNGLSDQGSRTLITFRYQNGSLQASASRVTMVRLGKHAQ